MSASVQKGTGPAEIVQLHDVVSTGPDKVTAFGGTGGGGNSVDSETKNYVDAKTEATRAENSAQFAHVDSRFSQVDSRFSQVDARFAEVVARLDALHPATWQQNLAVALSVAIAVLGIILAVLAYSGDRFDGGIAAGAIVDQALAAQSARDDAQDQKLDALLTAVDAIGRKLDEGSN